MKKMHILKKGKRKENEVTFQIVSTFYSFKHNRGNIMHEDNV